MPDVVVYQLIIVFLLT